MKFFPTTIFYTTHDGLLVWLCGRLENGERLEIPLIGTEPHFYVNEQVQPHESIIRVEPDAGVDIYGNRLNKIIVKEPSDVPYVRAEYMEPFEADVVYNRRIRYDYGIKNCIELPEPIPARLTPDMIRPIEGNVKPRIFTIDIETYYKKKGGTPAYPTNPVNCVTLKDSYSGKYLTTFVGKLTKRQEQELETLLANPDPDVKRTEPLSVKLIQVDDEYRLFNVMRGVFDNLKPDICRGWNFSGSTKAFDWPYLKNRSEQRNFNAPDWKRYEPFDSMQAYKKMHERSIGKPKDGVSLEAVCENEGFGGKVKYEGDLVQLYEKDPVKFIYYNIIDVYQTDRIDENTFGGLTENYLRVARMAGCSLEDTQHEMFIVDSYTFHEFHGKYIQPTNSKAEKKKPKGGFVFKPRKGVYRLTFQADNSQEYSAIIRSGNISPETKIPESERYKYNQEDVIISPNGNWYRKDIRGVFPGMMDKMVKDQDRFQRLYEETQDAMWKNVRQANKNINHSFFGNYGNPHWRNYDPEIAGDILGYAREHLKHNAALIESMGGIVIYGDTDSCYFSLPTVKGKAEKTKRAYEILAALNASYKEWSEQWGWTECHLRIKLENKDGKPYEGQLFADKASKDEGGAKKRYVVVEEGEVKGCHEIFEWEGQKYSMTIKGFASIKSDSPPLTRIIQPKLFKILLMDDDYKKSAIKLIKGAMDDIRTGKVAPEDLRIPMELGKDPEQYGKPTLQSKASLFSNQYLEKEFGAGDNISIYYGYIDGLPRTDCFALEWNDKVPPSAHLDYDKHIERALEKPLSTVLDAAGLNWNDVKGGVIATSLDDMW